MSSFKSKTPSLPSQAVGASVDRDQAVTSNVTDTISTLRWSPVASYLAASSWDGKVHIYDVANDLTAKGVAITDAELRATMDQLLATAVMQMKAGS